MFNENYKQIQALKLALKLFFFKMSKLAIFWLWNMTSFGVNQDWKGDKIMKLQYNLWIISKNQGSWFTPLVRIYFASFWMWLFSLKNDEFQATLFIATPPQRRKKIATSICTLLVIPPQNIFQAKLAALSCAFSKNQQNKRWLS